ncbi:MAG: deoxyribodipyrimidine photo-lyase [Planctomycetota bacterium]|jgi:deoxyribodipyrimidine photo-lyase|uniref:cryptochrome/photolyase family protein n=1 Tax=Patiriisocius sp. Uisw_047 TaxID=3230969 RepID=UPI0039E73935
MADKVNVFWFRRDLRLDDNVGFFKALHGKFPVVPLFIFDSEILDELPKDDARVTFIYDSLQAMRETLQENGSSLAMFHGKPIAIFEQLVKDFDIQNVITNHDYEVYAQERDKEVKSLLAEKEIGFYTYKDQVIFEKQQIVKDDGTPYVVYTPFKNKWKAAFKPSEHLKMHDTIEHMDALIQDSNLPNLSLSNIGFTSSDIKVPTYVVTPTLINEYEATRNFPAIDGTSHLGSHLRFGTVSIRRMMEKAIAQQNETFMNELIWREFFMQILWHFPKTQQNAFRSKYDRIKWRNNEVEFEKWKKGETGYLLVDAGMRELNTTGHMHNRVRMLVASFLCKHLLIDWRWGEAYFAEKLLDYEQSSNVGNWQWAAGSGVDAAPYFRIFNPMTQVEKFDKGKMYIKKWVPEFETQKYPEKMVDHKEARERCLRTYKEALA